MEVKYFLDLRIGSWKCTLWLSYVSRFGRLSSNFQYSQDSRAWQIKRTLKTLALKGPWKMQFKYWLKRVMRSVFSRNKSPNLDKYSWAFVMRQDRRERLFSLMESSLIERASVDSYMCWRMIDLQFSYISWDALLYLPLKKKTYEKFLVYFYLNQLKDYFLCPFLNEYFYCIQYQSILWSDLRLDQLKRGCVLAVMISTHEFMYIL